MTKPGRFAFTALLLIACVASAQTSDNGPSINAPVVGEIPEKMQMHGTAVVGDRIYLFGGDLAGGATETLWTTNVHSAAINKKTLKLEDWRMETPLPQMRAYLTNCVEVVNDRIYLMGGMTATVATEEKSGTTSNEVVWTRVQADGTLSQWNNAEDSPLPRVLFTATCSNDKFLYILGGQSQKAGVTTINVADIQSDGSLANWRKAGELPMPLYNHGACIQRGRIYAWGGLSGTNVPNTRSFSVPISSSGQIGAWREETPMPMPIYGAACCGINDYIVSVCGRSSTNAPTTDIVFSRLDGTEIKTWQTVHSNLEANAYHSLGLYKELGWVFITGGMKRSTNSGAGGGGPLVSSIQAFQIPQPAASQLNLNAAAGATAGTGGMGSYPNIDAALKQAAAEKKQVLAFFYSPAVPASKEFWSVASSDPGFAALKSKYIIAAVNSAADTSKWASKLGVFRVPSMVMLSAEGKRINAPKKMESFQDISDLIAGK